MKNKIFLSLGVGALISLALTGCGHNVATFSKGIRAVAGLNPDTYMLSLGFDYGENVTIAVKEKADAEYQGETTGEAGAANTTSGGVKTGSKLTLKTGDQTTGYVVDLEEAKQQ